MNLFRFMVSKLQYDNDSNYGYAEVLCWKFGRFKTFSLFVTLNPTEFSCV